MPYNKNKARALCKPPMRDVAAGFGNLIYISQLLLADAGFKSPCGVRARMVNELAPRLTALISSQMLNLPPL